MKKIFVDTDVVLDLLTGREPHHSPAQAFFSKLDLEKTGPFVSALTFPNVHYILRRELSNFETVRSLEKFKSVVRILPVDEKVISLALSSRFKDFEDAVQYYTAVQGGMTQLITRNIRDFRAAGLSILTPAEYLSSSPE